jgi:hypothetical protein
MLMVYVQRKVVVLAEVEHIIQLENKVVLL